MVESALDLCSEEDYHLNDEAELNFRSSNVGLDTEEYIKTRFILPLNEIFSVHAGELIYMTSRGFTRPVEDETKNDALFIPVKKTHIGIIGKETSLPDDELYFGCPLLNNLEISLEIGHDFETNDEVLVREFNNNFSITLLDNPILPSRFYALRDLPPQIPDGKFFPDSGKQRLEFKFGNDALKDIQNDLMGYQYLALQRELFSTSLPIIIPNSILQRDLKEKKEYIHGLERAFRTTDFKEIRRLVKKGFSRSYNLDDRAIEVEGKYLYGDGEHSIEGNFKERVNLKEKLEKLSERYLIK